MTCSVAEVRGLASAYQIIMFNNFYAHDEQGVNPGQAEGSTVSSMNFDRC